MRNLSTASLAGAAMIGLATLAVAADQPERVRGQIQSLNGDTLNVKSYAGKSLDLKLDSQTKYQSVVPAQLSDIKPGDFVGVGATGPENDLQALEVVIFPTSMRAAKAITRGAFQQRSPMPTSMPATQPRAPLSSTVR